MQKICKYSKEQIFCFVLLKWANICFVWHNRTVQALKKDGYLIKLVQLYPVHCSKLHKARWSDFKCQIFPFNEALSLPKHSSSDGRAFTSRSKGRGFESRWILWDVFLSESRIVAFTRNNSPQTNVDTSPESRAHPRATQKGCAKRGGTSPLSRSWHRKKFGRKADNLKKSIELI